MTLKIVNAVLMFGAVLMGLKQGYAMFSGKLEMLEMFSKWGFTKTDVALLGLVTLIASVLILFPRTFVWGNFLMAAGILLIICYHALDQNLKGIAIELPFLLLNMVIIYFQYPLKR
ncbi:hypothetical protein CLV98_10913 [Dyadobacter jejuensis]|uniref:DoxX-like protein n=1 Tax=Dyadobacter jejuensis TaxID=1082580 RepID=A0A316AIV6_9BACT|nr:hypothetical protein [Dyadobacter jejuensis]PWJ56904.1 hypothetical protein CLV98_10913 [Dyadobacter jejuensis]